MCDPVTAAAVVTAAATVKGVSDARKAQKEAGRRAEEAQRVATQQAEIARLDAAAAAESARKTAVENSQSTLSEMRKANEDTLNQMRTSSKSELEALEKKAAAEAADRQRQLESYNTMVSAQQDQAKAAREALAAESQRYTEQKAEAEKQAAAIQKQIEEQRRKEGEKESSRIRAARRGGTRALLSDARLNPEMGIGPMGAGGDGQTSSLGGA